MSEHENVVNWRCKCDLERDPDAGNKYRMARQVYTHDNSIFLSVFLLIISHNQRYL